MKKNLLILIAILVLIVSLSACTTDVSIRNEGDFSMKAKINLGDTVIDVDVKDVNDRFTNNLLEITAIDGTVYKTSYNNVVLINGQIKEKGTSDYK